nr:retrovirus-related Pol polyprotein from transposon TNT 1-94 [Tanacetum cinerariifolium]
MSHKSLCSSSGTLPRRENFDYPELIWEDIAFQIDHTMEKRSRHRVLPDVYQVFHWSDSPKKSRGKVKRKTASRRVVKKKVTIYDDDNIVPDLDVALELGKSISLTKANEEEEAKQVHDTHARIVTKSVPESAKKKSSGRSSRDIMQALKESKKTSKRQPGTGGSSEGTGTIPRVLDESTVVSANSSEETDAKPGVPDEEKDIDEENYKIRVRKDKDVEMLNDEVEYSGKVGTVKDITNAEISSLLDIKIQSEVPHIQSLSVLRVPVSMISKPTVLTQVEMDHVDKDVVLDDDQPQDTFKPKTAKTPNPEWFTQHPRSPSPDPEWNEQYLKSSDPERTYTTSITKNKAARYEIEGIEDMLNKFSKNNVYSTKKILAVKSVGVKKLHGYGHLEEIMIKRADRQLYKFKEGDFVDLYMNDIEDMLLLAVQHKLFHLIDSHIIDFIVALHMFTRKIEFKDLYTPSHKLPEVIYEDLVKQKRVMRADELYRITPTKVVNLKATTSHLVEIQKPKLKVYNRRPRQVETVGLSKKAKIVEPKFANNSEPNHTWGSNATYVPSSSSLVNDMLSRLFSGTVRFVNNQIAKIIGYGDYQLGNIIISRVYSVEGLGHNLFFVRQFYEADLEVAFQKNTCFIQNLESVDLLSRSRDTNLYIISLDDMLRTSLICLLSKVAKTKSWLWHSQLSHLNFVTLNKLAKDGLIRGISKLKFQKDHLWSACALGKIAVTPRDVEIAGLPSSTTIDLDAPSS